MAHLNNNNSRVDKGSGAIIFNGSPELQEIMKLQRRMNTLEHKLNVIIALLERGEGHGRQMEDR